MRDITAANFGETYPATRRALQRLIGPVVMIDVTGPVTYSADTHLCAMLRLAAGLGEVLVTVPPTTAEGNSFAIWARAGSWPRIVTSGAGTVLSPYGHTAGVPLGVLSVLVGANVGGAAAEIIVQGATVP